MFDIDGAAYKAHGVFTDRKKGSEHFRDGNI